MTSPSILSRVESNRSKVTTALKPTSKVLNGQFMTPATVANAMAEMFSRPGNLPIRLLDPGSGAGALAFAFLDRLIRGGHQGHTVEIEAYENDPYLVGELQQNVRDAKSALSSMGWKSRITIHQDDFIQSAVSILKARADGGRSEFQPFTHAIINPPYRKLPSKSSYRRSLSDAGIQANNLYSAFVALSIELLADGGELVAITPRSFCNGPYFRAFRELIYSKCSFEHIHIFEARDKAFKEEDVLQENIIFHLRKSSPKASVRISATSGRTFEDISSREMPHGLVIDPNDPDLMIRIASNEFDDYVLERMVALKYRLSDFDLRVSTGPVVDFRVRESISDEFSANHAPLIYPAHIEAQAIRWPQPNGRKPNAIRANSSTSKWLFPNGNYVLIKRFSSKEEPRRIYASLFTSLKPQHKLIGFENHLNVIHSNRAGVNRRLAKGLTAYFSSSVVDLFFRQSSGHTQVNATDLRRMPLPSKDVLISLSECHDGSRVDVEKVERQLEQLFRLQYKISSPIPPKSYHDASPPS